MTVERVLWLSPWMRPLARVYCDELVRSGIEPMLVTSDQHPESGGSKAYEVVLDPRPKRLSTWRPFADAFAEARRFDPDVVVTELVRDPRWLSFGRLAPRVHVVHDDRPHDAGENRPAWERAVFDRWGERAAETVAFSEFVAGRIGGARVVPLTSDVAAEDVPAPAGPEDRKDFVLLGRLNGYKNIDVALQAWDRHVHGGRWRGDHLLLIGDGDFPGAVPPTVEWIRGSYEYRDVLPRLSRAKGSIVHYRRASQSGVQVLSMQLGVTPIVSTEGALAEFQPPGEPAIDVDDVEGLGRAFDSLADPAAAHARGLAALQHYDQRYSAPRSAAELIAVIDDVVASDRSTP